MTVGLYRVSGETPFTDIGVSLGETLAAYGFGALLAGITHGLIKPLARTALSAVFVGILVAALGFIPLGFVAGDAVAWQVVAGMTAILGTITGVSISQTMAIDSEFDEVEERSDRLMAGELSDEELASLKREYEADLEQRKASRSSRATS